MAPYALLLPAYQEEGEGVFWGRLRVLEESHEEEMLAELAAPPEAAAYCWQGPYIFCFPAEYGPTEPALPGRGGRRP